MLSNVKSATYPLDNPQIKNMWYMPTDSILNSSNNVKSATYPLYNPQIKNMWYMPTDSILNSSNNEIMVPRRRRSAESTTIEDIENVKNTWCKIPVEDLQLYLYRISEKWSLEIEKENEANRSSNESNHLANYFSDEKS